MCKLQYMAGHDLSEGLPWLASMACDGLHCLCALRHTHAVGTRRQLVRHHRVGHQYLAAVARERQVRRFL